MRFKVMDRVTFQSTRRDLKHLWGEQGRVVRVNYDTNSYRVRVDGGGIVDCSLNELCRKREGGTNEEAVASRVSG